MSIIPDSPAGTSPLVEQMPLDLSKIEILPAFGGRLSVVLHSDHEMPEPVRDAVAAVTVYGDGRIEYHLAAVNASGGAR